jgi:hypothetical protein
MIWNVHDFKTGSGKKFGEVEKPGQKNALKERCAVPVWVGFWMREKALNELSDRIYLWIPLSYPLWNEG